VLQGGSTNGNKFQCDKRPPETGNSTQAASCKQVQLCSDFMLLCGLLCVYHRLGEETSRLHLQGGKGKFKVSDDHIFGRFQ
jgi:hypothetical protein